ncbi:glucosylglycerol 3-phosphatase [Azotobacter armeniacus]
MALNTHALSLDHRLLLDTLATSERLLIIQDLDGVCMGLVRDPLTRRLDRHYVEASKKLAGHFYVLTNGEHIGSRGVNGLVEKAFDTPAQVREQGLYLPGLAGGGVQMQDCAGQVSHPGVSDAELDFLRSVPEKAGHFLAGILSAPPYSLGALEINELVRSTVLDNLVSPTVNINNFHNRFRDQPQQYLQLQQDLERLMSMLLEEAASCGLEDSFFVHYAPNLGRNEQGERIKFTDGSDAGTTDFQFMLKGAVKEAGVLVILNHYYHEQTGEYPLGRDFNARQAPEAQHELLALIRDNFEPQIMPRIMGVGDTVTSQQQRIDGQVQMLRGGSDRGFLTLVQEIGQAFATDNVVVYIDSSKGEVRRPGLKVEHLEGAGGNPAEIPWLAVEGISDPQDSLTLNFVFPGGHTLYVDFFRDLAGKFPGKSGCR